MFVFYDGRFQPLATLTSYYVAFGVMFVFNLVHCDSREDLRNPIFWIGKIG